MRDDLLNDVVSAILEAHPVSDEAWWSECWAGITDSAPQQYSVRMCVISVASTKTPEKIGPFLRVAVEWGARDMIEPILLESLSFYGLAARTGTNAEALSLEFIRSKDPRLQIIAFSAVPPKRRWPASKSPALGSADIGQVLTESAVSVAGQGATERAWKAAWWRNDWALTGAQTAAANFYSDLSPGLDREPDATLRVSYALWMLPILAARKDNSNDVLLVRRGLHEGFSATTDVALSNLVTQLSEVLNADPDEWKKSRAYLRELVGPRVNRLSDEARRVLTGDAK